MRIASLVIGAVLAVSVMSARTTSAAGVNIAWNECYGEGTGTQNHDFACNVNTGKHNIVGSFVAPAGIDSLSGNEVAIDLQTLGTVPAWWSFRNTGSCRRTALTVNFFANPMNQVCVDEFDGAAEGGIGSYVVGYGGNPDRARLKLAIATRTPRPLEAGVEYFAFNLAINNQKTVGVGACEGCTTRSCLVLDSILLTQPYGRGDFWLSGPSEWGSYYITWQGDPYIPGCGFVVPTRNTTWGSVKSLYR